MSGWEYAGIVVGLVGLMVFLAWGLRPLCDCETTAYVGTYTPGPTVLTGRSPEEDLAWLESHPDLTVTDLIAGRPRWTISGRCVCGAPITASFMGDVASALAWVEVWLDMAVEAHLLRCPQADLVRTAAARVRRTRRMGEEILGTRPSGDQGHTS